MLITYSVQSETILILITTTTTTTTEQQQKQQGRSELLCATITVQQFLIYDLVDAPAMRTANVSDQCTRQRVDS